MPVDDFLLRAAKNAVTPFLEAEDWSEELPVEFSIDELLCGKE